MKTLKEKVQVEQIIRNSRFLSQLIPVSSQEEAQAALEKIQSEHKDATHNCFSYIIGKSQNIYKVSDDGEPSGTAGLPIYEVLKKNNLTNVLCVVTRYYGGIKLGAGGLIRAYASSTASAIKEATLSELIEYVVINFSYAYEYHNLILPRLESFSILETTFTDKVSITLQLPEKDKENLKTELINLTKNQIKIEVQT